MNQDDEELMRQINLQADAAERAIPTNQNISAIAAVLAEHFTIAPRRTSKTS
ncbi:hypothetical protein [Rhizobium gallicum]|uniref:hypothetical protein n=1 Tax=Rhizobium gallicum TaxID=56730 RepID=UPI000AE12CD5|nr:hypothetical protein [Rhizobium gallicum]